MPAVKLNISLDKTVAEKLRRRTAELRKPASRYLAELIEADDQRSQDELAAEGYRVLSSDIGNFATAALPLARETWPEWTDTDASQPGNSLRKRKAVKDGASKAGKVTKRRRPQAKEGRNLLG